MISSFPRASVLLIEDAGASGFEFPRGAWEGEKLLWQIHTMVRYAVANAPYTR